MPSAHGAHVKYAWQQQPDAVINQANPTSGLSYPVLVATEDVRIISICASVTWTVQPTPLQAIIAADGNTLIHGANNPVSATNYFASRAAYESEVWQGLSATEYQVSFFLEGQNIGVSAKTTGGTVSLLYCRVKWARLLPT